MVVFGSDGNITSLNLINNKKGVRRSKNFIYLLYVKIYYIKYFYNLKIILLILNNFKNKIINFIYSLIFHACE